MRTHSALSASNLLRQMLCAVIVFCVFSGSLNISLFAQEQAIPRYSIPQKQSASQRLSASQQQYNKEYQTAPEALVRGIDIVPYIVSTEDSLQSYIQDNAISVWVNVPSLQKHGDTLTAVIKRVMRYDIAHALSKDLISVDILRFNTRNDTFARVATLDKTNNTLMPAHQQEWEKASLDLDILALYHYVGYLYQSTRKK